MEEPISFDNWDFGKGFAWDSEDKGLPDNMTVFDEDSSDFDFVDASDDSAEEDLEDSDDSAKGATAKDEESDSDEEESVDLGEVFLREYLGEDYDEDNNEGRGVTLDRKCEDDRNDKENIYDPEEFDMNTYEWGAIRNISKIREQVTNQKDDGITLQHLHEMLKPFREDAIGYSKEFTSPEKQTPKWVQVTILDVPDTIEKAFVAIAKGEEGSGEDGDKMGKDYFLKWFKCEAIGFINDSRSDGDDNIEIRAKEVDDYYNGRGRYDGGTTGLKVGQYAYVPKSEAKTFDGLPFCMRILAFTRDGEKAGVDGAYLRTQGSGRRKYKISEIAKAFDTQEDAHKWLEENVGKDLNHLSEIEKEFGFFRK